MVRLNIEGFTARTLSLIEPKHKHALVVMHFLLPPAAVNGLHNSQGCLWIKVSDGKCVISTLCPDCSGSAQPRPEEPGQSWEELRESSHRYRFQANQSVLFHQFRHRFMKESDQFGSKLSGNKAEDNICWLISPHYTLMLLEFAFPTQHQMVQLVLLNERLTACVSRPPVQQWPSPERPISRRCPNSERMPSSHWCPGSLVSFMQVQVLLSVAEDCSRFLLNVNAMLQRGAGWFAEAETWSCRFYLQKWPNPLNSLIFFITFFARDFFSPS